MYILGISSYAHESSCALLKDGKVLCLFEEERFNREKHTAAFPKNAISHALHSFQVEFKELDSIAFYWNPLIEINGNFLHFLRFFPKTLNLFSGETEGALPFLKRVFLMRNLAHQIRENFHLECTPKVSFIDHHLAHAASAFYCSDFEEAAVLTLDGRGESTTTNLYSASVKEIKKLKEIKIPNSIGHFYAAITDYLGFRPFSDEWKVMGMSAYGDSRYLKKFRNLIFLSEENGFSLNLDYFSFHLYGQKKWLSEKFYSEFGKRRSAGDELSKHHFAIAYALQKVVEEAGVFLAKILYSLTNSDHLCVAGGVALNCLMNKKIVEETPFNNFFFQPLSGDMGASLGAALVLSKRLGCSPKNSNFSAYLGDEFSDFEVESVLSSSQLNYKKISNKHQLAAKYISEGKIVGWFQGRMEAGPRALGNRSILADPRRKEIKDLLNMKIKKRESFRPFAPAVLEEKASEFFKMSKLSSLPYMAVVVDVLPQKRELIPSVVHVDGTARLQTINKNQNQDFYLLIKEFEKITDIPLVINTSFNENEPIVRTPAEAVECFKRASLDVLIIGDFLVMGCSDQLQF